MAIYSIMRERLSIHLYLSVYHLFISYTSIIYHLSSTQYLSSICHLLSIYPLFTYLLSIMNLFIYHLDGQLSSVTLIYYLSPICPSTIIYLSYIYFLLQKAFNVDKDIPPKKKKSVFLRLLRNFKQPPEIDATCSVLCLETDLLMT